MIEYNLDGLVAVVTGAGRGLGRAMALGLAGEGVRVVTTAAREAGEIEEVASLARDRWGEDRIWPLLADVTRPEDCEEVVAAALSKWQRLDILVNNAGRGMKYVSERFLTEPTRFWETDPRIWKMVIDTNVSGPFYMTRSALPPMIKRGWGRVINISMNHETMRRKGFSPYGPSKAALESETVIWAQDLEGTGVTVNALLPGGATDTGMIPDMLSAEIRSGLLDPGIVVDPLLWLVSSEADNVTGQRITATLWNRKDPAAAMEYAGWREK